MPHTPPTLKKARIVVDLPTDQKNTFTAYCRARNITVTAMLKTVINTLTKDDKAAVPSTEQASQGKVRKTQRITLNLTRQEMDGIESRYELEGYGSRTEWAAAIIRGQLHEEAILTNDEIAALRESNRLLRTLGVNLNQIARNMNIDLKERGEVSALETEKISPDLLVAIRSFVIEHADKAQAIITKNKRRFQ